MAGTDRGPNFGIVVFTLIEVGAVSSLLLGNTWLMLGVVFAAFLAEHIVSYNHKRVGRSLFDLDGLPLGELTVVAGWETATWGIWFLMAREQPIVAGAILLVGLLVGHVMERNVLADMDLFEHFGIRARESLDFTALETVVGIGWLLLLDLNGLLAAAALAFGLYAEHHISARRAV